MEIRQGTFSYLPPLTDAEIEAQIAYALGRGWAISIEHTDDAHPRNVYWDLWEIPMFDAVDPASVMVALAACRTVFGDRYIRVGAYDATLGRQTTALSFIVHRPEAEPGFRLQRLEGADRRIGYAVSGYAADRPAGARYPRRSATR